MAKQVDASGRCSPDALMGSTEMRPWPMAAGQGTEGCEGVCAMVCTMWNQKPETFGHSQGGRAAGEEQKVAQLLLRTLRLPLTQHPRQGVRNEDPLKQQQDETT